MASRLSSWHRKIAPQQLQGAHKARSLCQAHWICHNLVKANCRTFHELKYMILALQPRSTKFQVKPSTFALSWARGNIKPGSSQASSF